MANPPSLSHGATASLLYNYNNVNNNTVDNSNDNEYNNDIINNTSLLGHYFYLDSAEGDTNKKALLDGLVYSRTQNPGDCEVSVCLHLHLKPHCTTYSYLRPLYSKQCLSGDP